MNFGQKKAAGIETTHQNASRQGEKNSLLSRPSRLADTGEKRSVEPTSLSPGVG